MPTQPGGAGAVFAIPVQVNLDKCTLRRARLLIIEVDLDRSQTSFPNVARVIVFAVRPKHVAYVPPTLWQWFHGLRSAVLSFSEMLFTRIPEQAGMLPWNFPFLR